MLFVPMLQAVAAFRQENYERRPVYSSEPVSVLVVTCCLYIPLHYRRRGQGSSAALHWSTLTARSHYPVGCNRTYQCMIVVGYG